MKTSQIDYGNDMDNLGTLGQMVDDLGIEDPDEMVGFSLPDGAKKGQEIEEKKTPALSSKILDL
jgi:hypothetical protein